MACLRGEQQNDCEVMSASLRVSRPDLQDSFCGRQASSFRRDASFPHGQHLPVLRASGNLQRGLPMYCGHLRNPSKDGIGVADHYLHSAVSLMPHMVWQAELAAELVQTAAMRAQSA